MSLVGVRSVQSFTALGITLTDDDQEYDDGTVSELRRAAQFAGVLLTVDGVDDAPSDAQNPPGTGPTVRTVKFVGDIAAGQTVVYDADQDAFVAAPNSGVWE